MCFALPVILYRVGDLDCFTDLYSLTKFIFHTFHNLGVLVLGVSGDGKLGIGLFMY